MICKSKEYDIDFTIHVGHQLKQKLYKISKNVQKTMMDSSGHTARAILTFAMMESF